MQPVCHAFPPCPFPYPTLPLPSYSYLKGVFPQIWLCGQAATIALQMTAPPPLPPQPPLLIPPCPTIPRPKHLPRDDIPGMCLSMSQGLWPASAIAHWRGPDVGDALLATPAPGTCAAALLLWTSCRLRALWPPQRCTAAQTACMH